MLPDCISRGFCCVCSVMESKACGWTKEPRGPVPACWLEVIPLISAQDLVEAGGCKEVVVDDELHLRC